MPYIIILFSFALAVISMAYIPIVCAKLKISYTVPLVFMGMLIYYLNIPIEWPDLFWSHKWVKVITEIIVILSLMAAGLKIGFQYNLKLWSRPLRLVLITMPIYIVFIFLLSYYFLGFSGPSSLLIAAILAPTDPVLASELQLGNPDSRKRKNKGMRYLLTAEAGLNDGMAFPFVYLAMQWQDAGNFGNIDLGEWLGMFVFYKIVVAAALGSLIGYLYSLSLKKIGTDNHDKILSGFVAFGLAILSFAFTELCYGYGFLSVFFTGLFAQYHNHIDTKDYSKSELLIFSEENEKLLTVLFCLILGGFIMSGIFDYISFRIVLLIVVAILIIRPLAGMIGLSFSPFTIKKKLAISFFGLKGIGSFFYMAYALQDTDFSNEKEIYAMVSLMVVLSILIHGVSGPRVISYFERHNPG